MKGMIVASAGRLRECEAYCREHDIDVVAVTTDPSDWWIMRDRVGAEVVVVPSVADAGEFLQPFVRVVDGGERADRAHGRLPGQRPQT